MVYTKEKVADAAASAKAQGRGDVAEYLSLKAANDLIRSAGVKWLFDSALEIAAAADQTSKHISIERVEPFNFPYRGANIVGSLRIAMPWIHATGPGAASATFSSPITIAIAPSDDGHTSR
jgi:hypothetical protein